MSLTIRPANALDPRQMADLLNEIIAEGGTTALERPVAPTDIADWMQVAHAAWHVAVCDTGVINGFQWIEPADYLPPEAAEIASFVKIGHAGLGIGSSLFEATKTAARTLGYRWINANIRADNEGGLIYYQSRGFRDYDRWDAYRLDSGAVVQKQLKRYDLY